MGSANLPSTNLNCLLTYVGYIEGRGLLVMLEFKVLTLYNI